MRLLLTAEIVLCVASAALGQSPSQRPHPAVVRVIATEHGGSSCGSGALVAVTKTHGLVVTNWHVVRDATGPIVVVFPDGFRCGAAVMKTDRDWDLAALAIWRPRAKPIALAAEAPRPGEVLTIAGYGPGWYRAATGRCIQYVSPGRNQPFEMVELSTAARNGDSGGPILNRRGELAGVLFGAALGRTTGSYCGRVRWFLASATDQLPQLPVPPTMIAQARQPDRIPSSDRVLQPDRVTRPEQAPSPGMVPPPARAPIAAIGTQPSTPLASHPDNQRPAVRELAELPPARPPQAPAVEVSAPVADGPAASSPAIGSSRFETIKTILAAIGILAVLFHSLRWLGAAHPS